MAMRQFTAEEFAKELRRRGCVHVQDTPGLGSFWRNRHGQVFQVPPPENPGGGYPDYILDDLIKTHNLPAVPLDD